MVGMKMSHLGAPSSFKIVYNLRSACVHPWCEQCLACTESNHRSESRFRARRPRE